jgi:hypothetical protein
LQAKFLNKIAAGILVEMFLQNLKNRTSTEKIGGDTNFLPNYECLAFLQLGQLSCQFLPPGANVIKLLGFGIY